MSAVGTHAAHTSGSPPPGPRRSIDHADELRDIVGAEHVFDDLDTRRAWARDESLCPPSTPRCVVEVSSAEQVKRIVEWANATSTPLVPVSSGPPHFRGDTVPSEGGAVVVDLRPMNGILRVDRRNRVAMIEPGVTYEELIPALREEGLAPYLPLAPRRTKSVIGSMLEREPITMGRHHWDAQDPLLCLEVVFGSGQLFRTGSAAGPGTIEEQRKAGGAQMRGMGPGQTDLQRLVQGAQGTLGIVTWATLKCRLLPQRHDALFVACDTLEPLVGLAQAALRAPLGDELLILSGTALTSLLAVDPPKPLRPGRSAPPPWVLHFGVDGTGLFPEDRIRYQVDDFCRAAQQAGLVPVATLDCGLRAADLARVLAAPSADPYWKLRLRGACEELFFLTTLDHAPSLIEIARREAEQAGYPAGDLGAYVQPTVQGTSCHCEIHLPYDRADADQARRVERILRSASESLAASGAFFSRPHGAFADLAYRRDAVTTKALHHVKRIFDPQNVMNPGKLCF